MWIEQECGIERCSLHSVFAIDALQAWACGSILLHTVDGGKKWIKKGDFGGNALFFINEKEGWIVGNNGVILHTQNGGSSFEIQESGTKANLYAITYDGENNLWVVGSPGIILKLTLVSPLTPVSPMGKR